MSINAKAALPEEEEKYNRHSLSQVAAQMSLSSWSEQMRHALLNHVECARSPHWECCGTRFREYQTIRNLHKCSVHGCANTHLEVHHLVPVHMLYRLGEVALELQFRNLMLLCREHHFALGHANDWSAVNTYLERGTLHEPVAPHLAELRNDTWINEPVVRALLKKVKSRVRPGKPVPPDCPFVW